MGILSDCETVALVDDRTIEHVSHGALPRVLDAMGGVLYTCGGFQPVPFRAENRALDPLPNCSSSGRGAP